jgi:DUF1680 family protein
MPENLFLAAELTGNPAFTELAHRYLLDRELFDPLARGADPFPGQHAYSHAIALSSAGRAYLTLGDPKYRDAMANAFTLLTTTQQFASGGWGPNETFITPHRGELHASLASTVDHFETPCGAYAATKLARYLIRVTPDSDGDYPYYSTYSPAAKRVFYQKKWPCCSGTLVQTVADYPLNLYFGADKGVYIAQFATSCLVFKHHGNLVHLTQETSYPIEDRTLITLDAASPTAFTVFFRIPAWLAHSATIQVNGKPIETRALPNTWAAIHRTWRAGDRIELTLPQTFRTEPIDDQNPNIVALMRGPLQYVALNSDNNLASEPLSLPAGLRQIAPQAFAETYGGRDIIFVPLYQVRDDTYTTYFTRA